MILNSAAVILRAPAALPAAGALVALGTINVKGEEFVTLKVSFTPNALTVAPLTAAARIWVRWNSLADTNIPTLETKGVNLTGSIVLTDEFYDRTQVSNGFGADIYFIPLTVQAGYNQLKAYISQVGDLTAGHEGTAAVTAWSGQVR